MLTFRTTSCAKHGHREVTVQFAQKAAIPKAETLLLSYFEDSVASGTQFKPGQTIAIGGQILRIKERSDGTLGVEEPVVAPQEQWVEQIDRTVHDVMLQRYVCDSVKLPLSYPQPRASCLMAACVEDTEMFLMTRLELDGLPDHASGWSIVCTAEHEHGERTGLPLLALAALKPVAVKFLALPMRSVVLVLGNGATVFHDGKQLTPEPGSYLEMLNARAR
jgi:hypothetical protein